MGNYVHGYTEREDRRLDDQSATMEELLHHDSTWSEGERVLEAGCGTGAQTRYIARRNPGTRFHSVDISALSIKKAKKRIVSEGLNNVSFEVADIMSLPYEDESFDHVFVCFVLEHLPDAAKALQEIKRVLKTGGSLMLIEGDHDSAFFEPDSVEAREAIQCLVQYQARTGGDANIGRKLYPLLTSHGYRNIHVSPRFIYADDSRPEWVEGFTRNTFAAMIESIREAVYSHNLMDREIYEKGVRDLYRTAEADGVFCYTFFKAFCRK